MPPQPNAVERYCRKRVLNGPWQLAGDPRGGFLGAVVIPALAEEAHLFATLDSLRGNHPAVRERFLVVVVVNHAAGAGSEIRADNARTLQRLCFGSGADLPLAWVDAASTGLELPAGGGVGIARKLGFDLALPRLDWKSMPLLVSLDADTLVDANYFSALITHFHSSPCGGAVLPFCHRSGETAAQEAAIIRYELYLRCYALGLALAGSPYGFPAVGSALACRAEAYVRCGGMNRRTAGEDFYFLQQLIKTVGVDHLRGTVVHPSPRISRRTPFGTGRSILRLLAGDDQPFSFFPVGCYQQLGQWLTLASGMWQQSVKTIFAAACALQETLGDYLASERFEAIWPRLQEQHRTQPAFTAAFHCWFDGLKTRQLLHRLANGPFPPQSAAIAVPALFAWAGLPAASEPAEQLRYLRGVDGNCVWAEKCKIGNNLT